MGPPDVVGNLHNEIMCYLRHAVHQQNQLQILGGFVDTH